MKYTICYIPLSIGWSSEWPTKISVSHKLTFPHTQIIKGIRNPNLHTKPHLIQILDKTDPTPITIQTTFQITVLASLGNHKPNHSPPTNNCHQNHILLVLNHNIKYVAKWLHCSKLLPRTNLNYQPQTNNPYSNQVSNPVAAMLTTSSTPNYSSNQSGIAWYMDSGATHHFTPEFRHLQDP